MNRKHLVIIFGIVILLLSGHLAKSQNLHRLDIPMIGVEEGDKFTYIVMNLVTKGASFQDKITGDTFVVETGDEFTLTIINSTPFVNFNEDFQIEVLIENENRTFLTDLGIGIDRSGSGNFFSAIDRILWENNTTDSNTTSVIYPNESIYFTENAIIYKFEITTNETSNDDFFLLHDHFCTYIY